MMILLKVLRGVAAVPIVCLLGSILYGIVYGSTLYVNGIGPWAYIIEICRIYFRICWWLWFVSGGVIVITTLVITGLKKRNKMEA